jgi:hypothetical protein
MIVPTESKCGDCTVCCQIMGFTGNAKGADRYNEAEKYGVVFPLWTTCNKLCDTGCSIQEDKPRICSEFYCSYVKYDLEKDFFPKEFGFVAHIQPYDRAIGIISMDKTLPPEIQYNNNKEKLDMLIDDIRVNEGKMMVVWLHTAQGSMRLPYP